LFFAILSRTARLAIPPPVIATNAELAVSSTEKQRIRGKPVRQQAD